MDEKVKQKGRLLPFCFFLANVSASYNNENYFAWY